MNNNITFRETADCLNTLAIPWAELPVGSGRRLIVTAQGGRAFGPFPEDGGEGLFWMSEAFRSPEALRAFLDRGGFHIGGERLWMGPELSFFCHSPELFDETYTVQPSLDPGRYELEYEKDRFVLLTLRAKLKDLRTGMGGKQFTLSRRYTPAANPLASAHKDGTLRAEYCGFTQDVYVRDESMEYPLPLEPWVLTQVVPGGHILIPYLGGLRFVDYYDPVDETVLRDCGGYVELKPDGRRKYKVAFSSAGTFGRFGYINRLGEEGEEYVLIIRNYYNDPSEPYCAEPWKNLGERGCSMYFYNDSGDNGGFAELEHTCGILGYGTGRGEFRASSSMWVFYGKKADLEAVILELLGIHYTITL